MNSNQILSQALNADHLPAAEKNPVDIKTEHQRLNYTQSQDQAFRSGMIEANPFMQFQKWFAIAKASNMPEPYAMVISTVDENLKPHSRVVLMREFTTNGLIFYTNYDSQKGQNLSQNSQISVLFFWQHLEQQVRIEGRAKQLSPAENQAYFNKRPKGSRIAAIASPQSQHIEKDALEKKIKDLEFQYQNIEEIPCPLNWGGYLIEPTYFEFWQGGASRVHDRIAYVYERSAESAESGQNGSHQTGVWVTQRLAP
jgi:pyridoxamine 5'-phosphate oxidase